MNMKKRIKAFFTLKRRANDGFTLVELIVVIAILAILGGVAVPAYSGYVKKAERAADEQLLASLNTAFASACAINGENHIGRDDAGATIANKEANVVATKINGFDDAFENFYEGGEFQVFTALFYSPNEGLFVADINEASGDILASYGGGIIRVTKEAITALKDSTFYGKDMDSQKLMSQIDHVAGVAGLMGTVANVKYTDGFADATLTALGIEPTGTLDEKMATLQAKARELALKELGMTEADVDEDNQYQVFAKMQEIEDNALVLYTAKSTSSMSAEEAKNMLNDVNSNMIKDAMDGKLTEADKAKGMNQAALAYGMYYAYINSDECTNEELKKDEIGATDVIAALDSNQEFRDYMAGEQGTKDMEAYLQALGVINSSTNSPEAVEKLVSEGFASEDMLSILIQSMGK